MQSTDLLPTLQELPTGMSRPGMSKRDMLVGLLGTDRAMSAAEFAAAASFGIWPVFDRVNVDDKIAAAYQAQYPDLATDHSLHEHWQEMMERGPEAMQGFINGLKGKLAEFNAQDVLEAQGYANVKLAPSPTQEGLDITATGPDGQYVSIQVKTGTSYSASDVQDLLEAAPPDRYFAFGTEIYDQVVASGMDTGDRIVADIGSDYARVEGITDGLETLSANMGIDIPDGVVDIIPYAAVVAGGARLVLGVIQTERQFKAADRTTKNQIQVVQTLTLMARMGITTVLATVGGMGGAAAGSPLPGLGNAVAGIGGTVVGAGMGMYLNRHLQPHMLKLALDITGLTEDDLFYYKNKPHIDEVASRFQTKAEEVAAAPGY